MLYVPSSGDFRWQIASASGRPATNMGTSITPSGTANTFTGYSTLLSGASVTEEVWGILINFNSFATSAAAKNAIATIGTDPAGGTSFTDIILNLLCTGASPYNVGSGGVWYYFPLFIPAGSSIGCKVSLNSTSTTAVRAWCTLFGKPTHPETTRRGTFVETIGATPASSSGTAITPGGASEGSWTSLGATSRPTWWHQLGWGANNSAFNAVATHWDLAADSAGAKMLIQDMNVCTTTSEQTNNQALTAGCVANVDGGTTLYARGQCSGAVITNQSVAAYCLGG